MARVYVGLDMGSSGFHQVGMDRDKTVLVDRKFDTGEANLIRAFDDLKGEIHVHVEAGELAAWVRRVLKGLVARIVVGHPKSSAWIAKDPLKRDRLDATQLADLLRMDVTLRAQKSALGLMKRESRKYPEIARFDSVPGLGTISACRFSAYVQTPHRFRAKRKLWRYCRLGITDRRSDGKPLGRPALDWNGNGRLKEMSRTAFNGAMKTAQENLFQRTYRRALQRSHNDTHARLSTQRKILAVLWAMWKRGTDFDDGIEKG